MTLGIDGQRAQQRPGVAVSRLDEASGGHERSYLAEQRGLLRFLAARRRQLNLQRIKQLGFGTCVQCRRNGTGGRP